MDKEKGIEENGADTQADSSQDAPETKSKDQGPGDQTKSKTKDKAPKVPKGAKKPLVNMALPSGKNLIIGKPVVLSKDDEKHLKDKFPDKLSKILA